MDIDQVIKFFGGPTKTARALGLKTRQSIYGWKRSGAIPPARQYQIELLSGGKFTAERPAGDAA